MEREDKDLELRQISQDANLDQDLGDTVPTASRGSNSIMAAMLFCSIALVLIGVIYIYLG